VVSTLCLGPGWALGPCSRRLLLHQSPGLLSHACAHSWAVSWWPSCCSAGVGRPPQSRAARRSGSPKPSLNKLQCNPELETAATMALALKGSTALCHQQKSPVPPQATSPCLLGAATAVPMLSSSLASSPSPPGTHVRQPAPGVLSPAGTHRARHEPAASHSPVVGVCISADGTAALRHEAAAGCQPAARGTGSFPAGLGE